MKKPVKKKTATKAPRIPKIGDKIYVDSSCHISRGSDDFTGGLATVSRVEKSMSGGDPNCIFVHIKEGKRGYNWTQFLAKDQERLKKEFGKSKAHPSPDIDTPWAEAGDIVDGKVYSGSPIW